VENAERRYPFFPLTRRLYFSFLLLRSYPIHAAILGGNLKLVKWFVSNRQCPLKDTNSNNDSGNKNCFNLQPLRTSKGRSPVQLALPHLDVLQFLVGQLNFSMEEPDLDPQLVLSHLTQLLRLVPARMVSKNEVDEGNIGSSTTRMGKEENGMALTDADAKVKLLERRRRKDQLQRQQSSRRGSF
jgi:hypothetical protein